MFTIEHDPKKKKVTIQSSTGKTIKTYENVDIRVGDHPKNSSLIRVVASFDSNKIVATASLTTSIVISV